MHRLLAVSIAGEPGVVAARQQAREIARLLGFARQDQIRIATATSEIARNAVQYATGGQVEFFIDFQSESASLVVRIADQGPGIRDVQAVLEGRHRSGTGTGLGIAGTRRLMDRFSLESTATNGTTVTFAKVLPDPGAKLDIREISRLSEQLTGKTSQTAFQELQRQNQELIAALETLHQRETELQQRHADVTRLSQELEDTNRGVLALYAELDERAAALRRADEIKSKFLSHMSHEFRTPLNSILALSDLLLRRIDGDLTAEQEKQINFMRRAAQELFEMVNDLLDIAKVEAGKVEIRKGSVDMGKLFGTLRGMFRPLATHEAVSLIFEDPGHLIIDTDEAKLGQILRNLISNALKFTERGEIRVSVKCVDLDAIFTVSDTGIGIAPEDQELIFQEFSQVDNPLQRKVKGTGLGLPLARRLAELLGGGLTVDSTPGVGSTFTLQLPLVCETAESVSEHGHESVAQNSQATEPGNSESYAGSILVIDDDKRRAI